MALSPAPSLTDEIREYLSAPRHATISTLDADGAPHQAIVWYLLDGERLLINSRAERRWPQNLQRDPRVSVAVQDRERPGHWVGLSGRAVLLHEGDDALADIQRLAERYGGNPAGFVGQARVTFAIEIDRTYEYWS